MNVSGRCAGEQDHDFVQVIARAFDVDVGVQLAHAPVRVFVMGERGANREPATEAEIGEMARIAKEAMAAGALGFSTSRTLNHRSADGACWPSTQGSARVAR